MSVKLMSAIFETEFMDLQDSEGNITKASTAKLVLLALADHANDEGEGAYPGLTKMERKTALSRQGILNTYDALKYNEIIYLVGESKFGTNNYTINILCFPCMIGGQPTLLVNPLDHGGQPTLPVLVNPLDPNHPITTHKPSKPRDKERKHQKEVDFKNMTIQEAYKLPTLRLYRDATGFFPGQPVWEFVHDFILENEITKEKLSEVYTEWKLRGFKSENVRGVLEWARDGIPESKKQGSRRSSNSSAANALDLLRR